MSLSWAVRGRTPDTPKIGNPLKKIVQQHNFLGLSDKGASEQSERDLTEYREIEIRDITKSVSKKKDTLQNKVS